MKDYQILNLTTNTETNSGIKILIADLSETISQRPASTIYHSRGTVGTKFIFLLESLLAQELLDRDPGLPLKLNSNDFTPGDLTEDGLNEMEVFYHSDYVKKLRVFQDSPYNILGNPVDIKKIANDEDFILRFYRMRLYRVNIGGPSDEFLEEYIYDPY